MSTLFILASICLIAFMIRAFYDGFYLHLWRYELFNNKESYFEHLMHTFRALLFPVIIWFYFLSTDRMSFIIGSTLIVVDLIIVGLDAYLEKESRTFMGGLPTWEYIIHLFANSLHFATFILILSTRVRLDGMGVSYSDDFISNNYFGFSQELAKVILPGAILLGMLHLILNFKGGKKLWYAVVRLTPKK